jgi:hypothetical protein
VVFDGAVILLEATAPRRNGAIEVIDGFEVLIDERLTLDLAIAAQVAPQGDAPLPPYRSKLSTQSWALVSALQIPIAI